jgi:fucose 4-O-acetylase-like acetyltransferase
MQISSVFISTLDRCLFPFIIFLFICISGLALSRNISKKGKDDKYGKCDLNYA